LCKAITLEFDPDISGNFLKIGQLQAEPNSIIENPIVPLMTWQDSKAAQR
jgi:hypothetical protein